MVLVTNLVGGVIGGALLAPVPAYAQQGNTWIDDVIRRCNKSGNPNYHSAIAFSDTGVFSCAWDFPDQNSAISAAVKLCLRDVPQAARQAAPCRQIVVNRKVVDAATVRKLKRPVKIPAWFEIYDKASNNLQSFRGYVELGRLTSDLKRHTRLVTNAGLELCTGSYGQKGGNMDLTLVCFNQFQFTKPLITPRTYTLSDGIYKPDFETRLDKNGSYIKIVTQN